MKKIYLILLCCLGTLLASSHAQGVADVVQVERLGLGTLRGVAYSPDGRTLYSYGGRGIIVRDAATGEVQRIIESDVRVSDLSISPDGRYLAAASNRDKTVKLWNAATGELLRTLQGHRDDVTSLAYSPDGQVIASGSRSRTIKLWNAATGELIHTLQGSGAVSSLAYSPDGQIMASGLGNGTIKLWNAATGELLRTLQGHTAIAGSLAYSPDGQILASGSWDDTIKLWNAVTGELIRTLQGHTHYVRSLAYSPDGQILASGSSDDTINLWNAATGELLHTLQGHTSSVDSLAYSPDGQILASESYRTIKLWNTATGELLHTLQGHTDGVSSLAYSPDGQIIASGSRDDTIKLWNTATGELLHTLEGHTDSVYSLAYSPDGQMLASGSSDDSIKLWNAATGELLRTLQGHTSGVYSLAYSPDGQVLASGSSDDSIKLWNAATGELIRTLQGHTADVYSLAYSPDGQMLASGSLDDSIKLWNATTGELLRTLQGHTHYVTSLAYSPDGQILASGSEDRTIKLWNAATGELIHTLEGHRDRVSFLAYSPDGQILASGSEDRTIKLWNAATGELLRTMQGHTSYVWSLAYSPDGAALFSSGDDGVIRVWATPNRTAVFCPSGSCSTPSLSAPQLAILSPSNGSQLSSSHLQLQLANNGGAAENYRVQAAGRSLTLARTSKDIGVAAGDTVYLDVTIPNDLQGQRFDVLVEASNSAGSDSESVALSYAPSQQTNTQSQAENLSPASTVNSEVPQQQYHVSITTPFPNTAWNTPQLQLAINIHPQQDTLPDLEVRINGQVMDNTTIDIRDIGVASAQKQLLLSLPSDLPSNRDFTVSVNIAGADASQAAVLPLYYSYRIPRKPDLYLLSVGVNHYADEAIGNLSYAADDAQAIANAFAGQTGKLYENVHTTVLLNEDATKLAVSSELGLLLQNAQEDDVLIVFIAAHGVNGQTIEQPGYFVILHDTDSQNYLGTALPENQIDYISNHSQAHVFFFLDTCHSGLPGRLTTADSSLTPLVQRLADNHSLDRFMGVFAASQGSELAQEDSDWGHGAFTKALLEGFEEAPSALSPNGAITPYSLMNWVSYRVQQLTNNQQRPMFSGSGGDYSFYLR